jgi:predicted nucleotidyltransferase
MRPTYSLETIFGSRSRVRVLRVLRGVRVPLNASQIAARTGLTHPAVGTVLSDLAAMGAVESSPAGRATVHWLNRENAFVRQIIEPVFASEEAIPESIMDDLRTSFAGSADSVVLYGSYARGDQTPDSDVDVVLVAREDSMRRELEDASTDYAVEFRRTYGATLSAVVYSPKEAAELGTRAPELQESLERDGIVVCGSSPRAWSSR